MNAKKKILLVEDDEAIQTGLTDALVEEGYDVVSLPNSVHTMDELRKGDKALLVMDLQTPEKNGWQFLLENEHAPELQAINCIVITAWKNGISDAYMRDHTIMTKPLDLYEFLAKVKEKIK